MFFQPVARHTRKCGRATGRFFYTFTRQCDEASYTTSMSMAAVIALFLQYKYPALVALSFVEGPYIMMLSGLLIKLDVLTLIPAFIALSLGDLLADTVWYYVGYYFGNQFIRRFGKWFNITAESVESVRHVFFNHKKKILVGSKMTAGFGLSLATLVTAGMLKTPFWEYLALNFLGQFVWTGVMLAVGYLFGNLYLVIDNVLGRVFLVGIALVVLYLLLRFVRRFGKRAKENFSE